MSTTESQPAVSPFLAPPILTTESTTPSIIHIKRDQLLAKPLSASAEPLTTRFGSFPVSSLLNIPYGSQEESKGFVYILAPTPELWTTSLPHRTQVVYTPDSSYVLSRLRVRPGQTIIEAGAGSGSFTHAAVRAIYGGPEGKGKVLSFEFHAQRAERLREELKDHGLSQHVKLIEGDVCEDGFTFNPSLDKPHTTKPTDPDSVYPDPHAIFLDLPSPHLAIPNIRESTKHAVHLCCFSPCVEQVTKTHTALHAGRWQSVETVELSHRRLEVYYTPKDTVSGDCGSFNEALDKLKVLARGRRERIEKGRWASGQEVDDTEIDQMVEDKKAKSRAKQEGPQQRRPKPTLNDLKLGPKTGEFIPVISRYEPELKTHTSYLTFATLPIKWDEEEEKECKEKVEREKGGYVQVFRKGWTKEQETLNENKKAKQKMMEEKRLKKQEEKRKRKERSQGQAQGGEPEEYGVAEAKEEIKEEVKSEQ
ncbi:GCD14-domain-containing protein [Ascobolus immersus RN42]|uniref:tRNA (adenine(58)-N(1))-methyltransferase catalytic subunit TRM61 n=1 Tax=Ascobolus immersus RN42 TaxID=1160509 RepID=A0A3N4ICJ9_ASCIM|nr:GCD14-domain-containing protein [Ascobolus immersus RN42]